MQDDEQTARAQQIWSQYLQLYPQDPAVPDVLLRQGLLYRKMGVDEFAISKFYAVMSTALKLKLDNLAYYKKLVVQAQTEIADTYYLDAKFSEAADFFNRILKSGDAEANREQLEWKLIRSLSYLTNHTETIAKAQSFLSRFPHSPNLPEVRFLLARALKDMGRNPDAMQQVLLLLQSQQDNVSKDPETWAYWQRRAGNEIANQLYKEGDNVDALQIYLNLAQLDQSPVWQVPVLYQAGMAYEQLQQWQKATRAAVGGAPTAAMATIMSGPGRSPTEVVGQVAADQQSDQSEDSGHGHHAGRHHARHVQHVLGVDEEEAVGRPVMTDTAKTRPTTTASRPR